MGIDVDSRQPVAGSKRQTGWVEEKVVFADLNQLMFEMQCDQIIGTSSDATNNLATCYYDSSTTSFKNKNGAAVAFLDGDRIAWRGLDTITANVDISTIDDLDHVMFQGVTIDLLAYDLDLGLGQRGEIDLSGTGTLTVQGSDGLRIKTGGSLTVVVLSGDKILNNVIEADNLAIEWEATNLAVEIATVATLDVDASKIQLVDSNNTIKIIEPLDLTFTMPTDLNAGSEKPSTWYEAYVGANSAGGLERKLVPILTGTTTSTSSGNLPDTSATFLSDLVLQNSIVLNKTDGTLTTVSSDAVSEITAPLADDIFTIGEDYEIYLTPTFSSGYDFRAGLVEVFNGSGNDFEKIKYKQPTKIPEYDKRTARAWVNFNGTGTVDINDSFNVSSITDNGVGQYSISFINPLADGSYAVAASGDLNGVTLNSNHAVIAGLKTANGFSIRCVNNVGSDLVADFVSVTAVVFGSGG